MAAGRPIRVAPATRWRLAAHVIGLVPLAAAAILVATSGLGPNPVESLTLWSGRAALLLLIASLACTPASFLLGWRGAIAARRTLGLYAFSYALTHFLVFVGVDYGFDLDLLRADALAEKPFVVVGAVSGAILAALAATSTRGWQRRLGRSWKKLHRLAYAAVLLAALHYAWKVKAMTVGPIAVAAIVVALLVVRLPVVRVTARRIREGSVSRP